MLSISQWLVILPLVSTILLIITLYFITLKFGTYFLVSALRVIHKHDLWGELFMTYRQSAPDWLWFLNRLLLNSIRDRVEEMVERESGTKLGGR